MDNFSNKFLLQSLSDKSIFKSPLFLPAGINLFLVERKVETFLPITMTTLVGPGDFSNVDATTDLAYTPGTFVAGLSFDNTETLGTFDLGEQ